MMEAIVTGIVAIMVCMINNHYQSKAVKQQHDKTISLIEYRLKELEEKVNKHNNLVERVYGLERRADVYDEKIRVANHRIDDLEDN
ncbi:hypothetical protein [Emergencia timonensis]|uniref:hypothetical protein n=1 Tax=Emergencia timonensis TaxID=1776384 RepID=UPI0039F5A692